MTATLRRFLPWTRPRESQEDIRAAWRELIDASRSPAPLLRRPVEHRALLLRHPLAGWYWHCRGCETWERAKPDEGDEPWTWDEARARAERHYELRTS